MFLPTSNNLVEQSSGRRAIHPLHLFDLDLLFTSNSMLGKVILLFEIGRNLEHFEVLAKRQNSELEGGLSLNTGGFDKI